MLEEQIVLFGDSSNITHHDCVQKKVKVAVFGKSGVGKSTFIKKLWCSKDVPAMPNSHAKTPGVTVSNLYWHLEVFEAHRRSARPKRVPVSNQPKSMSDNCCCLDFEFWDCGDDIFESLSYLRTTMLKEVAVCLFCFAVDRRDTWKGLPGLIESTIGALPDKIAPLIAAVATRLDVASRDVTKAELKEFEATRSIPVFPASDDFMYKLVQLLQQRSAAFVL